MAQRRNSLNIALWIAAVPVTLAAIRVLMFSRGDGTLLRVLVETLQVLPVLIASTLQVLPWAFASLGAILLFNSSSRRAVASWILHSQFSATLAVVASTVIVFVTPLGGLIGLAVLYGLVLVVSTISRLEKPWAQRFNRFTKKVDNDNPAGAFVAILLMPLLVQQLAGFNAFWLPREAVTVAGQTVDGYVLDVTGEWTTMLSPERVVLRFPTVEVTARAVCDQSETTTLLSLDRGPWVDSDVCDEQREPGPAVVR